MIRKDRVAAAFSAAAATYDQAAQVQAQSARHLTHLLGDYPLPNPVRGVEIGCGTGLLTRHLLDHLPGQWLITDLSPAMVHQASRLGGMAEYRVMDGEAMDLPDQSCDVIVSNLAFQWFSDLAGSVERLVRLVRPGGVVAFSTMGQGSFGEWQDAHARLGLHSGIPDYPSADDLRAILPVQARITQGVYPLTAETAAHFARGLKRIGATIPRQGHTPLSAGQLRRVMQSADRPFRTAYHLLFVTIPVGQP